MGITGQLQELDAVFDIALVGILMDLNVAQDSVLVASPVGGLAVEERCIDPSVKLVQIHCVQACLNLVVVSLQACDGLLAFVLLVSMALAQSSCNPLDTSVSTARPLSSPANLSASTSSRVYGSGHFRL